MAGVKPVAIETTDELWRTETVLSDRRGVELSISGENGETRRYQTQFVTLQVVRGGLEILNNHRGCYAWFEHCRLEARAWRDRLVLGFASGVVSSCGAELTIVAVSDPAAALSSKFSVGKQLIGAIKGNRQQNSKES
jgi:hypothetical protein